MLQPGRARLQLLAAGLFSEASFWVILPSPRAGQILKAELIHVTAESYDAASPSTTGGPYAARLKSRGVIRFDGENTISFLQGLVTNNVTRFQEGPPTSPVPQPTPNQAAACHPPMYAALLNPQGRFLYDLFLYRPVHPDERFGRSGTTPGKSDPQFPDLLADVDAETLEELVNHLKRHRLRAKVGIQDISQDLSVWQRYGVSPLPNPEHDAEAEAGGIGWGAGRDTAAQTASVSDSEGWRWWRDPRLGSLGVRGLFPSNTIPPAVEADEEVDAQNFQLWRLEQGVPEGPKEIHKGEAIALEYNLEGLNAISFDKGCYVGQELIARTRHRGVVRKRIMPLKFVRENGDGAQQSVSEGVAIVDFASQKKVGKVTTVLGPRGLGLLSLESVQKDMQLSIDSSDVYVRPVRPNWWPSDWGLHQDPLVATAS